MGVYTSLPDDFVRLRNNVLGYRQAHLPGYRRIDVEIGFISDRDGNLAGLLALQDADDDVPRQPADVVVVQADRGDRAALDRVDVARIDGHSVFDAHFDDDIEHGN